MAITERYVSTTASGGGAGTEGDPWTLVEAATSAVEDDRVNIKADGTYTLSANFNPANGGSTTGLIAWRGYTSTIGDGGLATIDGGGSYKTLINSGTHLFESCKFTASGAGNAAFETASGGIDVFLVDCECVQTEGTNYQSYAAKLENTSGNKVLVRCKLQSAYASTLKSNRPVNATACLFERTDSSTVWPCIDVGSITLDSCIVVGGGNGVGATAAYAKRCVVYGAGADAFNLTYMAGSIFLDCILYDVGGYGIDLTSNWDYPGRVVVNNVAMGAVTGGRINSAAGDLHELNPITLTADPFVDAANGDFRLNDVPGAGRECRHAILRPPTA